MAGRRNYSQELRVAAQRSNRLLWSVFLFSIFVNILMLTGPLFMLQIYDRVLGSRSEATLVALTILVAALFLLMGILDYARGRILARAGARYQEALEAEVFRTSLTDASNPVARAAPARGLRELETVGQLYSSPALLALCDIPWTPVFAALIFIFHPLLGWLGVAGGAFLIVLTVLNGWLTSRRLEEAQSTTAAASIFAETSRREAELIAAQGMESTMTNRWLALRDDGSSKLLGSSDIIGFFTASTKSFRLFLQSAMLAVGAWLVLQGELTPGAMIAGSIILGRALAPIEQTIGQWSLIKRGLSGRRVIKQVLTEHGPVAETAGLPAPKALLELKAVSIKAPGRREPVLNNVSLKVSPGEAVGIIGKSGSGKSSIARVILGITPPLAGDVMLNGAHLSQYSSDELGGAIGYLPQHMTLFPATVLENIARMEIEPDVEAAQKAAMRAGAHDIITTLPDGYMTQLGQNDERLSGGQVQRVGLARALYTDPAILVLDEPNSALDSEGTDALNRCIREFKSADRAVILMTHRPAAIAECDRLIVIDAGRVAADGPRDEVLAAMVKNARSVQQLFADGKPAS